MKKLKMHSIDGVDKNIEMIGKLFPNVITERKNEKGEVERAIDFDILRQEISKSIVDGNEERYQFTWPDKKKSILLANSPIAATLRPCREESVNFDTTENLYIEGDNLDVLKLLQETYLGKVKMIYIDPPYNTGNDFVYEDDFAGNADEFLDRDGQYDEQGNRMVQNTDSNGRFHTDWLNMIYPRLKVAKDLLADDGVIFISIDDNELENLKKVCDEVFGESNFISNMIWQKKTGASDANHIATITENILVYSKRKNEVSVNKNSESFDLNRYRYKDEYITERGPFYYDSLDRGTLGYHESLDYGVTAPDGTLVFPNGRKNQLNDGWRWKWGKDKLDWGLKNKFIEVKKADNKTCGWGVYYKIYLNVDNDGNIQEKSSPYKNLIQNVLNTHASSEAKEIFGRTDFFSNPKPSDLLKLLITISSDKESIVLDFFSGSATTAHAVLKLNAEDGGHRRFIIVQLPEVCDEKSEAYKAGYKNICEIGKERIRRAGKKINAELEMRDAELKKDAKKDEDSLFAKTIPNSEFSIPNLDIGFRVLKLESTNMKDIYYNPVDFKQDMLDKVISNIKEDRTPEDLLFQVMLELGVLLSSKIEETTIAGKKVFNVADNFLIACFDAQVTDDVVKAIAQKKPYYAVLRDSSLADDSVATNFDQIFATYSPDTVRRVL